MIGVKVNYADVIREKMARYARELRETHKPNRMVAIELYGFVMKNFQTEGGMTEAGTWAELEDSTIEWKERHGYRMILQNTGALRASFNPFSDWKVAGVGAQQILGEEGRDPDMAEVHEFGLGNVPPRPMLPTQEQAMGMAMRVYDWFIKDSRQRSGL